MNVRRILLRSSGALVALLLVYVASIGPAHGVFYYNWVVSNGKETRSEKSRLYRFLYRPLTDLADRSESARTLLESYFGVINLAIYRAVGDRFWLDHSRRDGDAS